MKVMFKSLAFSLLFLITSKSLAEVEATQTAQPEGAAYSSTNQSAGAVTIVLGKDQFNQVVLQSSKPVVVKFGAPWCPACVRSKAPYEKIAKDPELAHVTFVEMDFDKNSSTAQQYDVQSLPTFLYFNNGKLASTKTGYSENLKSEIANTVASLGTAAAPTETVQEPKKNAEEQSMQTPATQEEVSGPACAAGEQGFFANAINGINNFFNSVWNTVTGWFK